MCHTRDAYAVARRGRPKRHEATSGVAVDEDVKHMGDVFDAIAGADKKSNQGVYPKPGSYLLWVDLMKMATNFEGHSLFVASFDIIESSNPERPKGTKMDDAWNITKQPKLAPPDVKAFVAAVAGIPFEQVNADGLRLAVSDKNPMHGKLVLLQAAQREKRNSDGEFTVRRYSSVPPEYQARAKELRQAAGFAF